MSQETIMLVEPASAKDKAVTVPSYAWVILLVVFLASVAAPLITPQHLSAVSVIILKN
jgi:hypothetical protein